MPCSTWNRLIRQAETARRGAQFFDPYRVHVRGRRLQPAIEPELNAALLRNARAFRHEQIIERLERLLILASSFKTESHQARNSRHRVLRIVGPHDPGGYDEIAPPFQQR